MISISEGSCARNSGAAGYKKIRILTCALTVLTAFTAGCTDKNPPEISYPEFINEQEVAISGYSLDAMEPFISRDGAYLFFNSLNDSVDTSIYFAAKQDDVTFINPVKLPGVNGVPNHLDAVASMDANGIFYFVSTRNYPADIRNLQYGTFGGGAVTGVTNVAGDFYVTNPAGWIVMDAEISNDGNTLYYVNADFSGGGAVPSEAGIGIAVKNAGGFLKIPDSGLIMAKVNNSFYINYAPCVSQDGLELYFTRILKGTTQSEICVSVRDAITQPFSAPKSLMIPGTLPEAVCLTNDGQRIYYHKKNVSNVFRIYTMTRK